MKKRGYTVARLLVHWGTGGALASAAAWDHTDPRRLFILFAIMFVMGQILGIFTNPFRK